MGQFTGNALPQKEKEGRVEEMVGKRESFPNKLQLFKGVVTYIKKLSIYIMPSVPI